MASHSHKYYTSEDVLYTDLRAQLVLINRKKWFNYAGGGGYGRGMLFSPIAIMTQLCDVRLYYGFDASVLELMI